MYLLSLSLLLTISSIDSVSGGFATVHPNNKLSINAIEAYELEQFSPEVSVHATQRKAT